MTTVNQVDKRVKMDLPGVVKFQLLTHCYLEGISVSSSDLECLAELALAGESDLSEFCKKIFEKKIFKSEQTVRNAISKYVRKNLILKSGKSKKTVMIDPNLKIVSAGNVLLKFKILGVE